MPAAKRGRKGGGDLARTLVALVGSLEKPGDRLRIQSIADRLSVSEEEARQYVNLIQTSYVDDGQYLPVRPDDDGIVLAFNFGLVGRPVRLTVSESTALISALDLAAVEDTDPVRKHIAEAFLRPNLDADEVERTLSSAYAGSSEELATCASALVDGKRISFTYPTVHTQNYGKRLRKASDNTTGPDAADEVGDSPESCRRHVDPLHVHESEGRWYLDAYDLDRGAQRSFRIDKMERVSAYGEAEAHAPEPIPAQMVELSFDDPTYFQVFDWPHARVLSREPKLRIKIPNYGGSWLVRRICACGGTVRSNSEELNERAKAYAEQLLAGTH